MRVAFNFPGTSACACALSASFDSLSGGAIGRSIAGTIGTFFGKIAKLIIYQIKVNRSILNMRVCVFLQVEHRM